MKIKSWIAGLAGVAGCASVCTCDKPAVTVASPDGRNEIRLYQAPLRYEVLRDGKTLVGQSRIGLRVNGQCLAGESRVRSVADRSGKGTLATPVYKKASVDLTRAEKFADFGDWGVGLVARNDGVAYRFETKMEGTVTVDDERAELAVPEAGAKCWANYNGDFGQEGSITQATTAREVVTNPKETAKNWTGRRLVYLPFVYQCGGKTVAVTESDVRDYPIWCLTRDEPAEDVRCGSIFAGWPKKTRHTETTGDWRGQKTLARGGRWVRVDEHEDYLVKTAGTRTMPWRTFILADTPSKLAESDIVMALAKPAEKGSDFSWVKPGKVAWDWWNCFDNQGDEGCNTKTYERFIDFASKHNIEYVIFDEGWSEKLNIWKFHPNVDVPHLIDYANKRNVGIILWMAWAQVVGEEEKVASYFSKLGAKGFKVDFMDRGDADVTQFLERFAAACAKEKMLVDYHGVYRPVGLHRTYPNVINYEGVHGLEQMKWHQNNYDFMANDVRVAFCRMTAGPMDYTPGAMLNYAKGTYKGGTLFPGSYGTRCRQMAMMALFEAPLQMLCDSPTNYEKNSECFRFMAETPTVWKDIVALGGHPDSHIALAREAKDGSWFAAGMTNWDARNFELDTSFLGTGKWEMEIFRDADDADKNATRYVREKKTVKAGERIMVTMAPGGGFVARFTR